MILVEFNEHEENTIMKLIEDGYMIIGIRHISYKYYISFEISDGTIDKHIIIVKNHDYLKYLSKLYNGGSLYTDNLSDSRIITEVDLSTKESVLNESRNFITMISNDYICTGINLKDTDWTKVDLLFEYNCIPGGEREKILLQSNKFDDFMKIVSNKLYPIPNENND